MFPDSILMCDAIFLFNMFLLIFIYNKGVSCSIGNKIEKVIKILCIILFLLGTFFNVVQVIIRYWYREIGYYQELWHMGMICFYLSMFSVFIWLIVYAFFTHRKEKKNEEIDDNLSM